MRRPLAAGVAACLVLAAGCGSGSPSPAPEAPAPPEAPGSGYFVGTSPAGVGATVDLRGSDPASRAVETALLRDAPRAGPAPSVGIASIVNGAERPVRAPTFTAELASGELVPLSPARDALGGRDDPAARRAERLLPVERMRLPAGASAVVYLVLEGEVPGAVAEVRMASGPEAPIALAPRPR